MCRSWWAGTAVAVVLAIGAMITASAWAAPVWLGGSDVSAAGQSASVPDVVMSSSGDVLVTWQDSPAGGAVWAVAAGGGRGLFGAAAARHSPV
jgi:hypothetical protein